MLQCQNAVGQQCACMWLECDLSAGGACLSIHVGALLEGPLEVTYDASVAQPSGCCALSMKVYINVAARRGPKQVFGYRIQSFAADVSLRFIVDQILREDAAQIVRVEGRSKIDATNKTDLEGDQFMIHTHTE